MKRFIYIIIGVILPLVAQAQTPGYDPGNPPNPEWEQKDTTKLYTLSCEAIPDGAGSFSSACNKQYKAGTKVTIYASTHNSCYFQEWKDAEGNTVSTKESYTLTMPAKDITLYAIYSYNPDSPLNPELKAKYLLSVVSEPEYACTFNFKDQKILEGSTESLYAYVNNGFRFLGWKNEKGETVGTSTSLNYLMPSHNSTLTAVFEYAPEVPANPATNSWDSTSGELSIDYFKPDYLTSEMMNKVGSGNYDKVTHLMVDGKITTNDLGFSYYFKNLTYIDLSRVSGIETIPSYNWQDNTTIQEIELPACITSIGTKAFDGCTMLKTIDCYAVVPPSLGDGAFNGIPEDAVIYVPEASVSLYEAAEGWSKFTISPLRSKVCALEVNLPASCADGRYKNMTLELVNIKSGQKYRYVITDRINYTYSSMVRNTKYVAYLRNLSGYVIGQLGTTSEPIVLDNENVSVTFDELKTPRNLTLKVVDAANNDVTGNVTITWTDAEGTYLTKGNTLTSQIAGYDVHYIVTLPAEMEKDYRIPAEQLYTIVEGDNEITYTLEARPQYTLTGKIVSEDTHKYLVGMTVAVSQKGSGSYYYSASTTTGKEGKFSVNVSEMDVNMLISGINFLDCSIAMTEAEVKAKGTATIDLGEISVKRISGFKANVNLTIKQSDAEGYEKKDIIIPSPALGQLELSAFNKTTGKECQITTAAEVGYIVIAEGCDAGDELQITCSKYGENYIGDEAVTVVVPVNMRTSLNFNLTEKGGVFARFLVTDNVEVEGILYDKSGKLVEHQTYKTNYTQYEDKLGDMLRHDNQPNHVFFENLADGEYTLVTMGKSDFFNSIYSLTELNAAGMKEGVDYVANTISVKAGNIITLRNVVIPFFEESKLYYTGSNTSFSVNKASVIAGNYLTLNSRIDFLDTYKNKVSDVKLIVELPANCKMVDGSAIVGKSLSAYEYRDNTVTIALGDNYTDRIKFCVTPTERGNYSPNAFVQFTLDGKTVKQPIGSAAYTVTDLTIWTPYLVSLPTVNVDGNAAAMSEITVYDGTKVIGTTKALADGFWTLSAELTGCRNLSIHDIWAKAVAPSGVESTTETRSVEFNAKSVQAKSVEMTFYNHNIGVNRTIWVNFDLEHVKASVKSYMFEPSEEFVFTANLTNNSPEVVHSCVIRVFTINHEWIELPAKYIPNLDRWVAHGSFSMAQAPIGVRVNVDADIATYVEIEEVKEIEEEKPQVDEPIVFEDDTQQQYEAQPAETWSENLQGEDVDVVEITDEDDMLMMQARFEQMNSQGDCNMGVMGVEGQPWIVSSNDNEPSGARAMAPIATEYVTILKNKVAEIETGVSLLGTAINVLPADYEYMDDLIAILRKANTLITYGHYAIEDVNEWQAFISRLLPCDGLDDAQARAMSWLAEEEMTSCAKRYIYVCNMTEAALWCSKYMIDNYGSISIPASRIAFSKYMSDVAGVLYRQTKAESRNLIRKAKRDRNKWDCKYATAEEIEDKWDFTLPYPVVEPIIDPQGYVYEGVSTNRLEGVTATAYYRHKYEDMYGDLHEDIVLWDATEYAQQNPLLTDAQGFYQWDVPTGEWQVKFEKEGYQTAYSEWLPVPPPQMDVNIAMVQNAQPEVVDARAYEADNDKAGNVEITFSKYMKPSTLTAENIFIKGVKDGEETLLSDVAFTYPDAETTVEGSSDTLATRVCIASPELVGYDEVRVIVDIDVESYAGINMPQSYSQLLDVEKKVTDIVADAEVNVAFGGSLTVRVGALPAAAAKGKKISIATASSQTVTLGGDAAEAVVLTLDENGQADVVLNGALYGSTVLTVKVLDTPLSEQTKVSVVDSLMLAEVKSPLASRLDGTAVYAGQTVSLSCETEGAVIYYTTDGSCPCESAGRQKYSSPIVISDGMTLKIMAVGINGSESEVREYKYSIRKTDLAIQLAKGWNWISHNAASPLAVGALQDNTARVVAADGESVYDAQTGFAGAVSEMSAWEMYKLQNTASSVVTLDGNLVNAMTSGIALVDGWNWVGYPLSETLTPTEALSLVDATEGDVIMGQSGFAEFADGKWTGSLETLKPGEGYLFRSVGNKSLVYNTAASTKARAIYGHRMIKIVDSLVVDKHQYANAMGIVASIEFGNQVITSSDFVIAAFVGKECRGVGKIVDGLFYVTIYGNEGEDISFDVIDTVNDKDYEFADTILFRQDVIGKHAAPYVFNLGKSTGIETITTGIATETDAIYTLDGIRLATTKPGSNLTTKHGVSIIRNANGVKKVKR